MSRKFDPVDPIPLKRGLRVAILVLGGALIVVSLIGVFFLLGGGNRVFGVQERVLTPGGDEQAQGLAMTTVTATPTQVASGPVTMRPSVPSPRPTKIATPAPVLTPTATTTPTVVPVSAVVNAEVVDLHSGPGADYPIQGQVRLGESYQVQERAERGDWFRICCPLPGKETWIAGEFTAINAPVDAEPDVAIPPTSAPDLHAVDSFPGGEPSSDGVLASLAAGLPGPGSFGAPGEINPLTGQNLPVERRNRRPLIVCINNDIAARPQWGISRADVMYEYLMEGLGITRFSGVFYGQNVEQIGPIRSARWVNFYMGALYDAGLICSGASDPIRFVLKNDAPFPYLDIDLDDSSNSRYSTNVGSDFRTRLRTATDKLRRWLADWGVERAPSLRGFTFGSVPDGGAPASQITIPYPSVTGSQVIYRYDVTSRRYLRFLGGHPHLDGNNGQQLALDNVIVQFLPHQVTSIVEDSLGSKSLHLTLFGSGKAIVFRNGLAFEGSWRSESHGDMPRFYDQKGREIALNPGKTWISIVPPSYAIRYQ